MEIVAANLSVEAAYKLMIGAIVPRPIAWVTSLSANGKTNVAPFSAFTWVSDKPPMVAFAVGPRGAKLKDTARNIDVEREFVVNIGDETLVEPIHRTADEYPEGISEAEALGLALAPSTSIRTPRLAIAPINLECQFSRAIEFGEQPTRLIVGEVLRFHIRDSLYCGGKIDSRKMKPLARLGGPNYASLGEYITVQPSRRAAE